MARQFIKHPLGGWLLTDDLTEEEIDALKRDHGIGPVEGPQVPPHILDQFPVEN